jgi:hypothetical protein
MFCAAPAGPTRSSDLSFAQSGYDATLRTERATVVARVYGRQNPATAWLNGKAIPHFRLRSIRATIGCEGDAGALSPQG